MRNSSVNWTHESIRLKSSVLPAFAISEILATIHGAQVVQFDRSHALIDGFPAAFQSLVAGAAPTKPCLTLQFWLRTECSEKLCERTPKYLA